MKKVLSIILLSVLILTVFTSCTSGSGVTLLNFINSEADAIDMDGKTVSISSESDYKDALFEQMENTAMYDAIINRLDEIEKKYNCNIEHIEHAGSPTVIQNMMSLAATGDSEIDIIYGHGYNKIGKLAYAGILYPLTDLKDYIDYTNSEKFGTAGLLEAAMINGVPYAVQPVQWVGFANSFAFHLVWNTEQFTQFGLPNLHEYYENKTWTFENFEKLFEAYSAVANEEVDLIAFQKGYFALAALYANGVKMCDYDGSEFYCDIADNKSIRAAEWVLNLFNKYDDIITTVGSWETDGFIHEKVILQPVQVSAASLFLPYEVDFQYSLMPFPSGPDATYGEWANFVEAIRGFGISYFSDVPDAAARIINDLCEPFPEVTPTGLYDYYNEQVFYNPIDVEILLDVGKYTRNFYSVGNETLWQFKDSFDGKQTASQIIDKYKSRIEALVEEYIRPNFEGYVYDQLYGNK